MAWNKPSSEVTKVSAPAKSVFKLTLLKGVIGGGILTGIVAGVWLCMSSSDGKGSKPIPKPRPIPVAVPQNSNGRSSGGVTNNLPPNIRIPTPEEAKRLSLDSDHGFPAVVSDSNGVQWYRGVEVPTEVAGSTRRKGKPVGPRRYFKKAADNYLASLFIVGAVGIRSYAAGNLSDKFFDAMEKSLNDEVRIEEGDDEDARSVKQLMNELKGELRERLAKGETLKEIVEAEKSERAKITQARENYKQMYRELVSKETTTLQDVEDFFKAANSILTENHAMPLRIPPGVEAKLRARNKANKQ